MSKSNSNKSDKVRKPLNVFQRAFAQVVLAMFGVQLFNYLEEISQKSELKNMLPLVQAIRSFAKEVSIKEWTSLSKPASKERLKAVFKKHDGRMAIAAYKLGWEHIDKKVNQEEIILTEFEVEALNFGKEIILVYTDENKDNKGQIKQLMAEKTVPFLLVSNAQFKHLVRNSKLDDSRKRSSLVVLDIVDGVIQNSAQRA